MGGGQCCFGDEAGWSEDAAGWRQLWRRDVAIWDREVLRVKCRCGEGHMPADCMQESINWAWVSCGDLQSILRTRLRSLASSCCVRPVGQQRC